MIRPINIYALSRIRDEQAFCIVEKHDTGHDEKKRIGNHEIDSLRLFVNNPKLFTCSLVTTFKVL